MTPWRTPPWSAQPKLMKKKTVNDNGNYTFPPLAECVSDIYGTGGGNKTGIFHDHWFHWCIVQNMLHTIAYYIFYIHPKWRKLCIMYPYAFYYNGKCLCELLLRCHKQWMIMSFLFGCGCSIINCCHHMTILPLSRGHKQVLNQLYFIKPFLHQQLSQSAYRYPA